MSLQSFSGEILAVMSATTYTADYSKDNVTNCLQIINNFRSLSCVSKQINLSMHSEICISVFIRELGASNLFRSELPKQLTSWNLFFIQTRDLLINWVKNQSSYTCEDVPNGTYQPLGINENAALISYDETTKRLRRLKIGESDRSSYSESFIQFNQDLQAPGKGCFPFCAQAEGIWAISEGQSSVSILNQYDGQLLYKLENLGKVKQIEMRGMSLFILQEKNDEVHLLHLDTTLLLDSKPCDDKPKLDKLSLSISKKNVGKFFLLDECIAFVEYSPLSFRIWSISMSWQGDIFPETTHKWNSSGSYTLQNILVFTGQDFLLCDEKSLKIQTLKVQNTEFISKVIVDDMTSKIDGDIAEVYYDKERLFIFYNCRNTPNSKLITFDLKAKKFGVPMVLTDIKLKRGNDKPFATNSVGKVHLTFQAKQISQDNKFENHTSLATFDYNESQ